MIDEPEQDVPLQAIAVWDLSDISASLVLTIEGNIVLLAEKGQRGVVLGGAEIPPQEFVTKLNFLVYGLRPDTKLH